jgi:hypothetical protein
MILTLTFSNKNTAASPTLNVNSTGAKNIVDAAGSNIKASDLPLVAVLALNAASKWVLINPAVLRTDVRTVTVPASAWDTDGKATVAVPGMRANMSQGDFRVGREHASQIPVEAAAGLGDTDIIPGDGTITLTATGVIPTTALSLIVTIYGREG